MQIITNITNIRINNWVVDVNDKCVVVRYSLMTDQDGVWEDGVAYFWETIPPPLIDPLTSTPFVPDNWYQLPPAYAQTLTNITVDARAALLHLIA